MTNDRDKILTAVQASEDRIGKVLEALRHRHRAQRRAKNYAGARATLTQINSARALMDDVFNAKIKAIVNADIVKEILAEFKAVNRDVRQSRDDIKDLAKNLTKIAKAFKVVKKILAKVI